MRVRLERRKVAGCELDRSYYVRQGPSGPVLGIVRYGGIGVDRTVGQGPRWTVAVGGQWRRDRYRSRAEAVKAVVS